MELIYVKLQETRKRNYSTTFEYWNNYVQLMLDSLVLFPGLPTVTCDDVVFDGVVLLPSRFGRFAKII